MKHKYEVTVRVYRNTVNERMVKETVEADYMEVDRGDLCFYREVVDDDGDQDDEMVQAYAKGQWSEVKEKGAL
jgi:hypothetical protein